MYAEYRCASVKFTLMIALRLLFASAGDLVKMELRIVQGEVFLSCLIYRS